MSNATVDVFSPIIIGLFFFGGLVFWFAGLKHMRDTRRWLDGSINPESKQQKWHEDLDAVAGLLFLLAITAVLIALTVLLWPEAPPRHG